MNPLIDQLRLLATRPKRELNTGVFSLDNSVGWTSDLTTMSQMVVMGNKSTNLKPFQIWCLVG